MQAALDDLQVHVDRLIEQGVDYTDSNPKQAAAEAPRRLSARYSMGGTGMSRLATTLRDNNAAVRARREFTSYQGEAETQRQIDRAFRITQWAFLAVIALWVLGRRLAQKR